MHSFLSAESLFKMAINLHFSTLITISNYSQEIICISYLSTHSPLIIIVHSSSLLHAYAYFHFHTRSHSRIKTTSSNCSSFKTRSSAKKGSAEKVTSTGVKWPKPFSVCNARIKNSPRYCLRTRSTIMNLIMTQTKHLIMTQTKHLIMTQTKH